MSEATDESHPTREFSAGYRIYVLAILMGVNLFNYMDRAILGVLMAGIDVVCRGFSFRHAAREPVNLSVPLQLSLPKSHVSTRK